MNNSAALRGIARGLIRKHFDNSLRVGRYSIYSENGKANLGAGRPIMITGGQFMTEGGLSNFWYWKYVQPDGSLSVKGNCGYGGNDNFFKPISKAKAIELAKNLAKNKR